MRLFEWAKDGGPKSNVDAFFICEFKNWFSIAILKFNKGTRQEYHSHAFNALTVMLKGDMLEEFINGESRFYTPFLPKITRKLDIHRVRARKTSWAVTIRGPWDKYWKEYDEQGNSKTLTHGRVEV